MIFHKYDLLKFLLTKIRERKQSLVGIDTFILCIENYCFIDVYLY